MKILLDHCVPKPLKLELPGHQVSTAREMGWEALKNGDLLDQAQQAGFEVFITVDQKYSLPAELAESPDRSMRAGK